MSKTNTVSNRPEALRGWRSPKSRFGATAACIVLCAFIFNALTPLVADDWGRATAMTSVKKILVNSRNFYLEWDGRFVNTILGNSTFLLPSYIFDAINAAAFLALMLLIYAIAAPKNALSTTLLALTTFLTWLYLPAFGQITLWQLGSAIYLWAAVQIFAVIWVFARYYTRKEELGRRPAARAVLLFVLGAIAGNAAQNGSGGALLILTGIAIATWFKYRKIPLWMVTGWSGTASGLAAVVLAPGNSIREDALTTERDAGLRGLLGHFDFLLTRQYQEMGSLMILIAVLFAIYFALHRRNADRIVMASLFVAAGFAVTFVMMAAPRGAATHRTYSFSAFFLIAAAVVLIAGIVEAIERPGLIAQRALAAGIGVMTMFTMVPAVYDAAEMWTADRDRTARVIMKREAGKTKVAVAPLPAPRSKYRADHNLGDVTDDPNHWRNRSFAHYTGVKTVVARTPRPAG
ncbi:DUF3329 domain-containing protein [Sanguibacter sp. A247]|uniref:DUF3329 domain-containing protein n=1 Tax=unclassified Sanguibacter TaxID=2645534 RepID=UPI003FD7DEFA